MKEKEFMDIFQMRCSEFDAANLPDYRRGAYGVADDFGVELKSVDTRQNFAMVVYQHKKSPNSVLVELFKYILPDNAKKPTLVPIPSETLKKLTIGNDFHNFVVEFKGHGFIKGMHQKTLFSKRPSYELCQNTNAYEFIRLFGHALATALAYKGVVNSIDDGLEFNEKIFAVREFLNEMNEIGQYSCGIKNASRRIADLQEQMVREDEATRRNYETYNSAVAILARYGIEYENKRKEEPPWL